MPERYREQKEKAVAYLASHPITEREETLICQFISGVKTANVLILSKVELQPLDWQAYRYMHGQFFKDLQLYTLLNRITRWSSDPSLYWQTTQLNFSLWSQANLPAYFSGFFEKDQKFFRYLALSHAFQSEVRIVPLFPATLPLDTPFLSTLHEIEVQNGREIQTQIALLKNTEVPGISLAQKEEIVAMQRLLVAEHFSRFLDLLAH